MGFGRVWRPPHPSRTEIVVSEPILSLSDVVVAFDALRAVDGVSLTVPRGQRRAGPAVGVSEPFRGHYFILTPAHRARAHEVRIVVTAEMQEAVDHVEHQFVTGRDAISNGRSRTWWRGLSLSKAKLAPSWPIAARPPSIATQLSRGAVTLGAALAAGSGRKGPDQSACLISVTINS